MDNNPFRNNQPNLSNTSFGYMTPTMGNQPQPQQQQPYGTGYPSSTYPQQQQPWQSNTTTTGPNTPYSPLQAQHTSYPQQSTFSPSYSNQQPYSSPYNNTNTSSLMSSTSTTPISSMVSGGGNFGNTYQPYGTTMPPLLQNTYTGYNNGSSSGGFNTPPTLGGYGNTTPGYGNNMMQQQSPYGSNNFYIPANFGQSTTTTPTSFQAQAQQQPKHAPVDASTLLKGTQVKRVECPVCQKMIEGDDMAVNHHVNEHYN